MICQVDKRTWQQNATSLFCIDILHLTKLNMICYISLFLILQETVTVLLVCKLHLTTIGKTGKTQARVSSHLE